MRTSEFGADGEHRTHNLLFTRQLLCQIELHQQYRQGRRARAQPGLSAAALPHERHCPNVYTIHIVKERPSGAQKNPGGCEPTGVSIWSFPGRFENRAFQDMILGRLSHRFPTIRGERITTVKQNMHWYDIHAGQARASVSIGIGKRVPAPIGGG